MAVVNARLQKMSGIWSVPVVVGNLCKDCFHSEDQSRIQKNVYFLFQASNKTTAFMIRSAVASATASAVSLPEATKKEADEEDRRRKEKT